MMKRALLFMFGLVCGVAILVMFPGISAHLRAAAHGLHGTSATAGARAHSARELSFTANAPFERVAPLMGADKERAWSPEWQPQFLYPFPAADNEGMVFAVAHDHLRSTWVNTEFDLKHGRVQYVYMIPDTMVTVITIRLTPAGEQTQVDVRYDRTALSPGADAHVLRLGRPDPHAADWWTKQINGYLAQHPSQN